MTIAKLPSPRRRMRSVLRSWHRRLGLGVALVVLLQSVTGVLLVYRHELQAFGSQPAVKDVESPSPVSVQSILDSIEAIFPLYAVNRIHYPVIRGEPYVAELGHVGEDATRVVAINPYTGQIMDSDIAVQAVEAVFDLHHNLLLGKTGARLIGLVGFAVFILVLTGFWLWWPGIRRVGHTFRAKPGFSGIRGLYDLHRLTGCLVAAVVLVSALTGLVLAYSQTLRTVLGVAPRTVDAAWQESAGPLLEADELISRAQTAVSNSGVRDLRFEEGRLRTIVLFRHDVTGRGPFHRIRVDPYTGRVLDVSNGDQLDAGNMFFAWMYPLHIELALANPGKAIVFAGGIGMLLLGITGPWLWWQKRK